MTHKEIRSEFYRYFQQQDHKKILSAPLVPFNDPSLLFTNAGMNQFKDVFLQRESREYKRAVTIQKCLRVSGKHNDFDEVGRTDSHHTFFEMLGNFSFGDYFKEKAIALAWEFLTEVLQIPREKLRVTVFREDDEAAAIWRQVIGLAPEMISRRDESDNFWQMGDTGPCGPCSEIYFDRGLAFGPAEFSEGNRRFVEIWNLVFMQFQREANGVLTPLPAPSIDTGMGMERLCASIQGVPGNYQTDLFLPLIEAAADSLACNIDAPEALVPLRVMADHCRALVFLIADGILPANDGRGYVLRRLLRRAVKHGLQLKNSRSLLVPICRKVISEMSEWYPELSSNEDFIIEAVDLEEDRFHHTLAGGLKSFLQLVEKTVASDSAVLSGAEVFRLSDTYGFPLDFARDLAVERDLQIDMAGFERELEAQRQRSRSDQQEKRRSQVMDIEPAVAPTDFIGYDQPEAEAKLLAIYHEGVETTKLISPGEAILVFNPSPFYAQAGGQIGDRGTGWSENGFFEVLETRKTPGGIHLHLVKLTRGYLETGSGLRVSIDRRLRRATAAHHTATHLLHAALREVLGPHVKQSGSYVGPDKLRFDFTQLQALKREEINKIEQLVNAKIRENLVIKSNLSDYDEAVRSGAIAIFNDKYGSQVRVVTAGDFSAELCGGTHADRSGELGLFTIVSEASIASGIRRIEALAGEAAWLHLSSQARISQDLALLLRVKPSDLLQQVKVLQEKDRQPVENKTKKADLNNLASDLARKAFSVGELNVCLAVIEGLEAKELRGLADQVRNQVKGLVILALNGTEKSSLALTLDPALTKKYDAVKIARELVAPLNGNGGGRPDFAQAGGDLIKDEEAFRDQVMNVLRRMT